MSAFIVGQDHIDFLVTAAIALGTDGGYGLYWQQDMNLTGFGSHVRVGLDNANEFGAMLWSENITSVRARYPHDEYSELPGPVPTPFAFEYEYRRFALPYGDTWHDLTTIAQVLKAIDCYVYQSCEHPTWVGSRAEQACDALRAGYIKRIPDYEDAEWEVSRPEMAVR